MQLHDRLHIRSDRWASDLLKPWINDMSATSTRISLANLTVGRTPQPELIRAAAEAGFGKVGLLIMTATAQPLQHEVIGRPEVIREIKAALGTRMSASSTSRPSSCRHRPTWSVSGPPWSSGPKSALRTSRSIGTELAPNATFLSPEQRIDLFGRLCDEAVQFGLTVGVEFMMYRDIRTWQ